MLQTRVWLGLLISFCWSKMLPREPWCWKGANKRGSNSHIFQRSEQWLGAFVWIMRRCRVIQGRGVNRGAQGARGTSTSTPSCSPLLELLLVNISLCGWPGFTLTCVGIQRKMRGRSTTCTETEKRSDVPVPSGPMWPEHDHSDDSVWFWRRKAKTKKVKEAFFYGPCREVKSPRLCGDKSSEF